MSAAAEIEVLLEKLKSLPKGTTFEQALASLKPPEAPVLQETRRRCALVRAFDDEVYAELTRDLPGAPTLKDFIAAGSVNRLAVDRWALDEATRAPLLRAWQTSAAAEWKNWNARLGKFFKDRDRSGDRLDALYHLAGCPNPDEGLEDFERWYKDADQQFDLAQCNALLEILRIQEGSRGSKLTRAWHDYRQYYQARQLSADDFFKTGAYFERFGPLEEFEKLLAPGAPEWVLHIHATGGSGKTMFLRWLTSRVLVPRRIPCARIDFDDFSLSSALDYPNRIFARIIDQLAAQVPGSGLTALREKLQRELESPGWNTSVPEEIGRQLLGANIETNLVVMLDTLEDVTRTARVWMETCMQALRRLHELHPKFVVILSGRYDISKLTGALKPGEFINYELTRFTAEEADAYLSKRGIPKGAVRDAIVERAGEGADTDADKLAGRNPFKLAMFAELTLNGSVLTADAVRKLPRVDIAYLIQRVIMRIPSQPLRWAVRYGVVARHLNLQFIEGVLLPPLKDALRGKAADDPNEKLATNYGKVWEPDPALAETITAADIWNELKTYTRERGWISLVGSEAEGTEELRFHPDVIDPTRELLSGQSIYRDLHRRATQFFHERSGLDVPGPARAGADDALLNAVEAVFHRFQLDGPEAANYWDETVSSLYTRYGPGAAAVCAAEITGSPYAQRHVEPEAPIMSAAILRDAHCQTADLLLQDSYLGSTQREGKFSRHVEWAMSVASKFKLKPVPQYLVAIHDSSAKPADEAIELLEAVIKRTENPRELALLHGVVSWRYREAGRRDDFTRSLEKLLTILPRAQRVGWDPSTILQMLFVTYRETGQHMSAIRALGQGRIEIARESPGVETTSNWVDLSEAGYALEVGDLPTARKLIGGLADAHAELGGERYDIVALRAGLALAEGNASEVFVHTSGVAGSHLEEGREEISAELLELRGLAFAKCLEFSAASNCWERAGIEYDRRTALDGAARCHLHSARLAALQAGNINEASALVDSSVQLRGSSIPEIRAEFQLLRAYTLYRRKLTSQARLVISDLWSERAAFKPLTVANIAFFELLFGLTRLDRGHGALLDAISYVHPPSIRAHLLQWCEFSGVHLQLPEDVVHALADLFELDDAHEDPLLADHIARAMFLGVLGQKPRAIELLRWRPRNPSPMLAAHWEWHTQLALLRLGEPTSFRALLGSLDRNRPPSQEMLDAIALEAALEAVRCGARGEALEIAKEGMPFLALRSQGQSRWIARIEEAEHYALNGEPWGSQALATSRYFESLSDLVMAEKIMSDFEDKGPIAAGAAAPEETHADPDHVYHQGAGVLLNKNRVLFEFIPGPKLLPHMAAASASNEAAIDTIMRHCPELAGELSDCLSHYIPSAVEFVGFGLPSALVGLPWEFAPVLKQFSSFWRTNESARRQAVNNDERPQRVLLLRPREGSDDVSLESVSGDTLESIYYRQPDCELDVLFDPRPEQLQEHLVKFRPTLIHINAVMRETGHGVYLDFESTESRADELGARRGPLRKGNANAQRATASQRRELVWTTTRLSRALQAAPVVPSLVLDIAAARNVAETVRMLILRNQFAHQLFQIAPLRTLLAAGLGGDHERLELTRAMIEALISKGPVNALFALREFPMRDHSFAPPNAGPDASLELPAEIPRRGAALWGHTDLAGMERN